MSKFGHSPNIMACSCGFEFLYAPGCASNFVHVSHLIRTAGRSATVFSDLPGLKCQVSLSLPCKTLSQTSKISYIVEAPASRRASIHVVSHLFIEGIGQIFNPCTLFVQSKQKGSSINFMSWVAYISEVLPLLLA